MPPQLYLVAIVVAVAYFMGWFPTGKKKLRIGPVTAQPAAGSPSAEQLFAMALQEAHREAEAAAFAKHAKLARDQAVESYGAPFAGAASTGPQDAPPAAPAPVAS